VQHAVAANQWARFFECVGDRISMRGPTGSSATACCHAFHLENGRASYRNRWVRTPKWQAEHDAGRACSAASAASCRIAPPSTIDDGGVANTNIIFHGGRLLALEEGHLPTEIEPGTLNRLGYCDYKGAIKAPFTAHPKIDPVTGEDGVLRLQRRGTF